MIHTRSAVRRARWWAEEKELQKENYKRRQKGTTRFLIQEDQIWYIWEREGCRKAGGPEEPELEGGGHQQSNRLRAWLTESLTIADRRTPTQEEEGDTFWQVSVNRVAERVGFREARPPNKMATRTEHANQIIKI